MQATTAPPQAPSPAAPSPATPSPVVASPSTAAVPQTAAEVSALRARRSEMSSQLSNVEGRRNRLVEELQAAPAEARIGLQERIRQLDQRILQIETDLQETGRLLTMSPVGVRGTTSTQPPAGFPVAVRDVMSVGAVLVFVPIAFAIARRIWKRTTNPPPVYQSRQSEERMHRLEQAVDAIALEIERVGESQRYQAKILAEAQLMPALGAGEQAAEPIRVGERERVRAHGGGALG